MKPRHTPPDGGNLVQVLGVPIRIRVHGRDTGGVLSVVETRDGPDAGPPPHVHQREDETFQVLAGRYEFVLDGTRVEAGVGSTLFAPRGVPHTYRCVGPEPGRLLCVITPAGFEGFFEVVGALDAAEQQDIPRIVELGRRFGVEFPGAPGSA